MFVTHAANTARYSIYRRSVLMDTRYVGHCYSCIMAFPVESKQLWLVETVRVLSRAGVGQIAGMKLQQFCLISAIWAFTESTTTTPINCLLQQNIIFLCCSVWRNILY